MLLRSVRLQYFRGVKTARISFDSTTVLIGENDCGRSSVMEAIALALGWNCAAGEFKFEPFHLHGATAQAASGTPPISITLEFGESSPGEWNGDGFRVLREGLSGDAGGQPSFWFEVTHSIQSGTRWAFRVSGAPPVTQNRTLLDWLRHRMPVLWMNDGMMSVRELDVSPRLSTDDGVGHLADQVSRHYRDLLQKTATDVSTAIEAGSRAAQELFLTRVKLLPDRTTPMGEVLEQVTGKRKSHAPAATADPPPSFGSGAHKIGVLLLAGAMLRSGSTNGHREIDPLSLIENPEAHLHPTTLASIWSVIDRIDGQKIIATHSGTLLAYARLSSVRRLTRHAGQVKEWRVPDCALTADELRRYSYHLRSRRAAASFARCWLLVEGETEFWMMSELARACGYDFDIEGVTCVEFAQCGLSALIKVARRLGIEWHLLADGDQAGHQYAQSARQCAGDGELQNRITVLKEADIEHCFWRYGYQDVFREVAFPQGSAASCDPHKKASARSVISRAIDRHSKPYLAAVLLDAVMDRGAAGVPSPLRSVIETCIRLARG